MGHWMPHWPQLLGSVCRFAQVSLQQVWFVSQWWPQLPQLLGSFCRSAQ
jgi:hypothetical protein